MNKTLKILSILLFSSLIFVSCLKTEEVDPTPECAILTFSVGDISTSVITKTSSGNDTTITRSVSGSSIYFNIDQVNGIITNVDSVANWIDLSKVCPSFTSNGSVYCKLAGDSTYYSMTSGKDTINFENPVDIMVVAKDGKSTKHYNTFIKRSSIDPDSLVWKNVTNNFPVNTEFKALILGEKVYAFFKNPANNKTNVTYSSIKNNPNSWTTAEKVYGAEINYGSVVTFNDNFYALGTDGYIYKATDSANPVNWEKAGDQTFDKLLSSDKYYVYASDGNQILSSKDLINWTSCGTADIDMLPTRCISSFSYDSRTNSDMCISMMTGLTDSNKKNGVSWYKVTSDNEEINQDWMYVKVTNDNPYGLPKFKNMSATYCNGSIYAIGVDSDTTPYTYKNLYRSLDNGISWHPQSSNKALPTDLDYENGYACIISSDATLWIIQQGGKIWAGKLK